MMAKPRTLDLDTILSRPNLIFLILIATFSTSIGLNVEPPCHNVPFQKNQILKCVSEHGNNVKWNFSPFRQNENINGTIKVNQPGYYRCDETDENEKIVDYFKITANDVYHPEDYKCYESLYGKIVDHSSITVQTNDENNCECDVGLPDWVIPVIFVMGLVIVGLVVGLVGLVAIILLNRKASQYLKLTSNAHPPSAVASMTQSKVEPQVEMEDEEKKPSMTELCVLPKKQENKKMIPAV